MSELFMLFSFSRYLYTALQVVILNQRFYNALRRNACSKEHSPAANGSICGNSRTVLQCSLLRCNFSSHKRESILQAAHSFLSVIQPRSELALTNTLLILYYIVVLLSILSKIVWGISAPVIKTTSNHLSACGVF